MPPPDRSEPGAPDLRTGRLLLRPLALADLDAVHAHWSDPRVRRWLWDDRPLARATALEELRKSLANFAARGFGIWGVHRRDRPGLIGTCGLLTVPEEGEVELLFSLDPEHWRRGYATEASLAVLDRAFDELGMERVVGRCDVPNQPSRRVLEKLGMAWEKTAPIRGMDNHHFGLSRGAYRRRRRELAG